MWSLDLVEDGSRTWLGSEWLSTFMTHVLMKSPAPWNLMPSADLALAPVLGTLQADSQPPSLWVSRGCLLPV